MRKIVLASFLVSLLVLPSVTNFVIIPEADAAAVDYYLKIDGIDGESTDSKHKNWIELESYSFGATRSVSGGGGGAGKVSIHDLMVTKKLDKSSPKLFLATATGEHIKSAEIVLVKSSKGQEFLKWKFTDVIISSYNVSGEGDIPTDQVSLSFSKVEFEYRPLKADGSLDAPIKGGWDLKTNKKI